MVETGSNRHRPRRCTLRVRKDFDGFGFYLHELVEVPGHFVGGVEPRSPAHSANLARGDRIIEVNGAQVHALTHLQVVRKVQASGNTVTLLVVDPEADHFYHKKGVRVHGGMKEITDNNNEKEIKERTPRLCTVHKWESFRGYGFNLHGLSSKAIHLIGTIDTGSPAEASGLESGDVIVEVNGTNVETASHDELVRMITSDPTQVQMFVISHQGYELHKEEDKDLHASMPGVSVIEGPSRPLTGGKSDLEAKPDPEMSTVISGVLGMDAHED